MTDDNLREALQGMRQPQPGIVYIADVLAYVEPELERLRGLEMFGNEEHAKRLSEVESLQDKVRHLNRRDEIHAAGLKLAHRRQAELKADRDRARDAAVALEQEIARIRAYAERCARSGSHAYAKAGRELLEILDGGERS